MAVLAGGIEILAGIPEFGHVFPLDDVEHFEPDVPQRLDARIPLDRIFLESFTSICAGDSSVASGPVLLFTSPIGANGRTILSR